MSDNEVYDRLREPFEDSAHSADTGRGFELTSIKAAYVFERLNEVFGLCGTGWRYAHSTFDEINKEIITWIVVQYAVEKGGCGRVDWDAMVGHWRVVEGTGWSEPLYAVGGNQVGKGSVPVTDAKKSALTNGITKAASMIGVGSDVFKGLVRVGNRPAQRTTQPSPQVESARERAKTTAKPPAKAPVKTDGKIARPMSAETVKRALAIKAGDGTALASTKQAGLVSSLSQEVWAEDKNAEQNYHSCLRYLFGVDSATKLTKGQATAFISYLLADPDSGSWDLHNDSDKEMKAVLTAALKDAGQQTLPLDQPFEGEWEDTTV